MKVEIHDGSGVSTDRAAPAVFLDEDLLDLLVAASDSLSHALRTAPSTTFS
jgi:hypothetical protein